MPFMPHLILLWKEVSKQTVFNLTIKIIQTNTNKYIMPRHYQVVKYIEKFNNVPDC